MLGQRVDGLMLDRRGWFIALERGPRIGCLVGFQTGNWVLKNNLAGKKKNESGDKNKFGGSEELAPRKKLFRQEQILYLPTSVLRWIHDTLRVFPPFSSNRTSFLTMSFPPLFFKRNEF